MSKHLFFDLDRTLWDFDRNSEAALKKLYAEPGLHKILDFFDEFHDAYKQSNAQLWKEYGKGMITKDFLRTERFRLALKQFDITDEEIIDKISQAYIDLSPKQTHLFPKTVEVLEALKNDGFRIHIITNGFPEVQYIKLQEAKLKPYFDFIFCSEEVGYSKPSKGIFQHALNQTGAEAKNAVMIGDDYEIDILGALNCGMHAILFDPHNRNRHHDQTHCIQTLEALPERLTWVYRARL
jgi:putative hydrolase of the HAD superfamily